jgi:hypothetical protein
VGFSFLKKAKLICAFFRKEKDKILSKNLDFYACSGFLFGTHRQEVNIWPVFERDIFPFLFDGTQNWL